MSYNNSFRILISEGCDLEAIRQIINELASEKGDGYDIFELYNDDTEIHSCEDEFRWAEWIADMTKVSLAIPHLTITVFRAGEDHPDYERVIFRNGMHVASKGFIDYPPLEEALGGVGPVESATVLGKYFAALVKGYGTVIIQSTGIARARMNLRTEYGTRNIEQDGLVWIPRRETLTAYKINGGTIKEFE